MKRVAETIITIVGMVLYGLPIVLSVILLNIKDNPDVRQQFEDAINSAPNAEQTANVNMDQMIDVMGNFAIFILVASLISIALGILAIVFLKGNKKPKAAGIILIVTAIIMTFGTVGLGLFAGVAYLIAGIVALARKPNTPVEDSATGI